MEIEAKPHSYVRSFHDFTICMGVIFEVLLILFLTGKIQGAWSWQGSQEVATNMDYQGPTWSPHKK